MNKFIETELLKANPLWIKLKEIKPELSKDDFPMIDFFLKQMEHTRKVKFVIKDFRAELEKQLV